MKGKGFYGKSQEHSLCARGVPLYFCSNGISKNKSYDGLDKKGNIKWVKGKCKLMWTINNGNAFDAVCPNEKVAEAVAKEFNETLGQIIKYKAIATKHSGSIYDPNKNKTIILFELDDRKRPSYAEIDIIRKDIEKLFNNFNYKLVKQ